MTEQPSERGIVLLLLRAHGADNEAARVGCRTHKILNPFDRVAVGLTVLVVAWALGGPPGLVRAVDPQQITVEITHARLRGGKLGGRELNFSSDIDLVLLYPEAGETDGRRPIANEDYFTRLGQALVHLLNSRTAEGFVFRVDMRLRPYGESGPLTVPFAATERFGWNSLTDEGTARAGLT